MEQCTPPLRRSNRLRRQTSKGLLNSSPSSSPGTSANAGHRNFPRSTLFYGPGDQSDSDSSLQSTTSSTALSSECFRGSHVAVSVSMLPPKLAKDYKVLAPILGYSDAELMEQDIAGLKDYVTEITAFTQTLISVFGHCCQWPEEKKIINICNRIEKVVAAKEAALPPKMPAGEESWSSTADCKYIQDLYRNAAPPSNFGWDDVGAGGSNVQSQETPPDYSFGYPYPQPRSIDYCTIPDNNSL